MEEFIDFFSEPDAIYTFLSAFLSAFLGVFTAIITERLISKRKDDDFKKILKKMIVDELTMIRNTLEKSWNDKNTVLTYQYTCWKTMMYTGSIKLLIDEKYYQSLLEVCADIDFMVEIEKTSLHSKDISNEVLINVRKNVLDQLCSENLKLLLL